MTKEELSRLAFIVMEIELLKKQIAVKPEDPKGYLVDFVKGSSVEFPHTQHNVKVSGYDYNKYYAKLSRLQKKLNTKLEELMDEKDKIIDYINTVDDCVMRMILMCKYVDRMTWDQIGASIGYSRVWIRKKHAKFFGM